MSVAAKKAAEWWASEGDLIEATIGDMRMLQEKLRTERRTLVQAGADKKSEAVASIERRVFEIGYRLRSWERYVKVVELRENPLLSSTDVKRAKVSAVDSRSAKKKVVRKNVRRRVK